MTRYVLAILLAVLAPLVGIAAGAEAAAGTKGMTLMMPLVSLWIGFVMPGALGLYWIASSFFTIASYSTRAVASLMATQPSLRCASAYALRATYQFLKFCSATWADVILIPVFIINLPSQTRAARKCIRF